MAVCVGPRLRGDDAKEDGTHFDAAGGTIGENARRRSRARRSKRTARHGACCRRRHRRRSPSSGSACRRCRSLAPRRCRSRCSTATTGCCGPTPRADGRWRLPVAAKDVDPRYLAMLLAFEDKRFRTHRGVDPYAIGRAAWLLVRHGRIVSGGSTLTMQVARLLAGEHERSAPASCARRCARWRSSASSPRTRSSRST